MLSPVNSGPLPRKKMTEIKNEAYKEIFTLFSHRMGRIKKANSRQIEYSSENREGFDRGIEIVLKELHDLLCMAPAEHPERKLITVECELKHSLISQINQLIGIANSAFRMSNAGYSGAELLQDLLIDRAFDIELTIQQGFDNGE